ncbi:MAG: DUF4292 domain-containing protein [Bacteroidales bacterium]|nr:DUF4292 domain-containing protein [Bacteroidales bacterium]
MKAVRLLIFVLAISTLFSACKTSRHAQRKTQKENTEETLVIPIRPQKPQNPEVVQSYAYNWVSYRGPAEIVFDGKKYQCNYYLVNRTDSILYLNLNFMGLEIARLVATPKEVVFINKLSNEYYQGDYAFVEKYLKAKADFYTLQAVFNGDETKLKAYQDITVSYHRILNASINRPFFDSFSMSMNNGQRKIDAQVKNLKFNTPGPTGIKIPEGFREIKM